MAATTAQSLSALLRRSTIEDHEEVLRACNSALKKSKTDIEAQHVKVVALLKLDRYEDALRVFEDGGEKLKDRLPLERAYALYKQGKYAEAEKVTQLAGNERGLKHVEAQTVRYYRKLERWCFVLTRGDLELPAGELCTSGGNIQGLTC